MTLLLACGSIPVAADAPGLYREGLDLVFAEDWTAAAQRLRQAIEETPTPSLRLAGGSYRDEDAYLPHYYLGVALHGMNDCLRALEALGEADAHGVARTAGRGEPLDRLVGVCQVRLVGPAITRLDKATTSAAGYLDLISRQRRDPALRPVWSAHPDWFARHDEDARELAATRRAVDGLHQEAGPSAIYELETRCADLNLELESLAREVQQAAIAFVEQLGGDATLPATPVPAILADAAAAYFDGRYRRVLELLESQPFSEAWAGAQSQLFQAASMFSLYHRAGENEQLLLLAARTAVQASVDLDETIEPDPRYFSPRFVAFFEMEGE